MYVGIIGSAVTTREELRFFFLQNPWMKNIKERKWVCLFRYCSCYVIGVSLTEYNGIQAVVVRTMYYVDENPTAIPLDIWNLTKIVDLNSTKC